MVDYSIDESFDLHFNDSGSFVEVDGKAEFEEDLVVVIEERFSDVINGYSGSDNITQKIQLLIKRIASESGVINSIERINITEPVDKPETVFVEIGYSSGDTFEELI